MFTVLGAISLQLFGGKLAHKVVYIVLRKELKFSETTPRYPRRFSGVYIKYPQVLELTISQSHLPGDNAAAVAIQTVPIFSSLNFCHTTDDILQYDKLVITTVFCVPTCTKFIY